MNLFSRRNQPIAHPKGVARRLSRCLIVSGLCLHLGLPASLEANSRSIRFNRISIKEGLSQSTVTAIVQDRRGFVWLGTQDGLNRFDGYDFVVYEHDPNDPATLSDSSIRALLEDRSGDLWVGTERGLSYLNQQTGRFTRHHFSADDPMEGTFGERVETLLQDADDSLWIATFDSGLYRLDPTDSSIESFQYLASDPTSLSDNQVRALALDRLGNLWVGTQGGLNLYDRDSKTFIRYRHDPNNPASLSDDHVLSILEDRTGNLWIGTVSGLNRFDRPTTGFHRLLHDPTDRLSLSQDRVRILFEDQDGRLWIGTDGGMNLFDRDRQQFHRYQHSPTDPSSLSQDRVMSIYQDRGQVMWIGTWGGGVNQWNPAIWSFPHYRHNPDDEHGLSTNPVLAFAQDAENHLWIGTHGGGLNRRDPVTGFHEVFRHDPEDPASLGSDLVTALLHDRSGVLWIGLRGGGLNRFNANSKNFTHFINDPERPESLGNNGVMSLFEDRRGDLWVGTYGAGLSRLEPTDRESGSFNHYRARNDDPTTLGNDRVSAITEDSNGALWVGTFGAGLHRLDTDRQVFTQFSHNSRQNGSLRVDTITALQVDESGVLWIGTQGGGLCRLEQLDASSSSAVFECFSESDGLPSRVVSGIQPELDSNALWLSTNYGLSRFEPATGTIRNYEASHGLQSNEFNFGAHFRSDDGTMYFGGVEGYNGFQPDSIIRQTAGPPVVLTSFLKYGQPVDLDRPLQDLSSVALDYRDHVFSFEFAALDFTASDRNRYAYRLEGLTEGWIDWIDLGTHRRVTFTDLDPGSYTLQIKAANHDGIWNEEAVSLDLVIAPPVWRTWWAYSLYALALVAAGIWLLASTRRKQQRQIALREAREAAQAAEAASRVKGDFLAHMSHEIRTPMSGIIGMTELLLLSDLGVRQREQLETIRASGDALLEILNDILDFSKIESLKLELEQAPFDLRGLIEEALSLVAPIAADKELALGYWMEDNTPETVIGDSVRTRQVLMNLLSNGVKFTEHGGVFIEVSAQVTAPDRHEIQFSIRDSGIGIPPDRLRAIFQPFSQVDASTTRRYGGTGLGLAICNRLSELMGGSIWADSTPDYGSTFHFTIVAKTETEPDRSFLYRSDPRLAGLRVLIIDENADMRLLLSRQADAWGMLPIAASSAATAIERLSSGERIDMAIMDREIAHRDEVNWAKAWGREGLYRDLPLVLLTPLARNENRNVAPGAEGYTELSRPIKPAQLHEVLTELAVVVAEKPTVVVESQRANDDTESLSLLRVLLAEDNLVNQKVTSLLLQNLGYRCDVVGTGTEVLAAMERQTYDLVLMDVQMPEMDGFEATRRIHQRFPGERPTVVAMTAHAVRGYRDKCLEAGMDDYISKPIKLQALAALFERLECCQRPVAKAAEDS